MVANKGSSASCLPNTRMRAVDTTLLLEHQTPHTNQLTCTDFHKPRDTDTQLHKPDLDHDHHPTSNVRNCIVTTLSLSSQLQKTLEMQHWHYLLELQDDAINTSKVLISYASPKPQVPETCECTACTQLVPTCTIVHSNNKFPSTTGPDASS